MTETFQKAGANSRLRGGIGAWVIQGRILKETFPRFIQSHIGGMAAGR